MHSIEFRPRAEADLDGILVYLSFELDALQAAKGFVESLYEELELAAGIPGIGKPVVDQALNRPYRKLLIKTYWVFYTYDDERLTVWRIISTLRDLDHFGFDTHF